jgi:hypothetical protein
MQRRVRFDCSAMTDVALCTCVYPDKKKHNASEFQPGESKERTVNSIEGEYHLVQPRLSAGKQIYKQFLNIREGLCQNEQDNAA